MISDIFTTDRNHDWQTNKVAIVIIVFVVPRGEQASQGRTFRIEHHAKYREWQKHCSSHERTPKRLSRHCIYAVCSKLFFSMKTLVAVALAAVFLASRFGQVQIAAGFAPDRLSLVDAGGSALPCCGGGDDSRCKTEEEVAECIVLSNPRRQYGTRTLLVRGNAPLNSRGRLDADMLVEAVRRRVQTQLPLDRDQEHYELQMPSQLVIVSLVSPLQKDEAAVLQEEISGVRVLMARESSNPGQQQQQLEAKLIHAIPIAGNVASLLIPSCVYSYVGSHWLERWLDPTGGAWELSERLHAMVNSADDSTALRPSSPFVEQALLHPRTTLIYFHCMRGVDRTGLLYGTYARRYLGASRLDVQRANRDVGRRPLQVLERRAPEAVHARVGASEM